MKLRYVLGGLILSILIFVGVAWLFADEQPPFQVEDPAVMENFRRIYKTVDQQRQNDGTHVFVSSGNGTQLDRANVYASSVTIAANTTVVVAPAGLSMNMLPIFSEMDTSSKTVICSVWASSFSLTNTSGTNSKTVNWWVFGRKP